MAPLILIAAEQGARRESAVQVLLREGFRVAQAASGGEALALVAQERPAAVVLDLEAAPLASEDIEHILRSELTPPPVIVALARGAHAAPEPMVALQAALREAGVGVVGSSQDPRAS